jgi:hypothetical protein
MIIPLYGWAGSTKLSRKKLKIKIVFAVRQSDGGSLAIGEDGKPAHRDYSNESRKRVAVMQVTR